MLGATKCGNNIQMSVESAYSHAMVALLKHSRGSHTGRYKEMHNLLERKRGKKPERTENEKRKAKHKIEKAMQIDSRVRATIVKHSQK